MRKCSSNNNFWVVEKDVDVGKNWEHYMDNFSELGEKFKQTEQLL